MEKKEYERISDCLDVFINRLVKVAALTPGCGLMTGKTGLAILFYEYASFKDDKKINEQADQLIDSVLTELSKDSVHGWASIRSGYGLDSDLIGFGLASGMSGIAYGFNYLIKRGFMQAEEDIFEEIDSLLFDENTTELNRFSFVDESEKMPYLLSQLNFNSLMGNSIRLKRVEDFLNVVTEILNSQNSEFIPCYCRDLFCFFHACEILRSNGLYLLEIDLLYQKLLCRMAFSFEKEKNNACRYVLESLLKEIPVFSDHLNVSDYWKKATLTEVNSFYLHKLFSARTIATPKVVDDALLSIVEDKKRMDELLLFLNPNNAELDNYVGGLAWALLCRLL